jgi:hypothetical protein
MGKRQSLILDREESSDMNRPQAGILAPGSSSGRPFPLEKAVALAAFVPGYSGGSAVASHHTSLFRPKAPVDRQNANNRTDSIGPARACQATPDENFSRNPLSRLSILPIMKGDFVTTTFR